MKKNNKKIFFLKFFLFTFFISLGLAGLGIIYLNYLISNINKKPIKNNVIKDNSENKLFGKKVFNILFLGIDTSIKKFNGRSDTIMVVSINLILKEIKIISLLRDIWVNIPNHSPNRLNAAYSLGGALLTQNTILSNFNLNIDKYIAIDFNSFEMIIDSINGIKLCITQEEMNFINNNSNKKLINYGEVILTGNQALQYVRDRDSIGSDYARTERQRKFAIAVKIKICNLTLTQIVLILRKLLWLLNNEFIKTNFSPIEFFIIAKRIKQFSEFKNTTFHIPTYDNVEHVVIDKKSVIKIPNFSKAINDLYKYMNEN